MARLNLVPEVPFFLYGPFLSLFARRQHMKFNTIIDIIVHSLRSRQVGQRIQCQLSVNIFKGLLLLKYWASLN